MSMSIAEFVEDEGRMRGYHAWLDDKMTQALLELARTYTVPSPLKHVTGENALYNLGLVEGANLIVTLLTKMEDLVHVGEVAKMMAEEPMYGAEKILRDKYGIDNVADIKV